MLRKGIFVLLQLIIILFFRNYVTINPKRNIMENNEIKDKLEFNDQSLNYLNSSRKWTMFFAILGFIFIGFIIIIALLMLTGMLYDSLPIGTHTTLFPLGLIVFFYFIGAILHFFPAYFLVQFSIHSKKAILYKDEYRLETAMRNLKNFFTFIGVLTIIAILFYVVIFLGFGIGTMLR